MCCNVLQMLNETFLKIQLKQCLMKMEKIFGLRFSFMVEKQGTGLDAIQWAKKANRSWCR